jgi:hypothetical protein
MRVKFTKMEWQMEWLPPGSHESQRAFPTPAVALQAMAQCLEGFSICSAGFLIPAGIGQISSGSRSGSDERPENL